MDRSKPSILLLLLLPLSFLLLHSSVSQPFIGINYGEVADNLPPPERTARLLQSTSISKLRLYGVDRPLLLALAGTNISVIIGTSNGDIPSLASDPSFSHQWVADNVLPFHAATPISTISVGNEVLLSPSEDTLASQLLPAMQNLRNALSAQGLYDVKVSTVHSMAVLKQSEPPSSGLFHPSHADTLGGALAFLRQTGGPFMINPYPYFAYQSDPTPDTLAFCLFQPNPGRLDGGTGISYTNMFDAQVDAVRSALNAMGFPDVEVVVAETGWPYNGDPTEVGATLENARAYNGNLVAHLKSMVGSPLMPGRSIDTYLFGLYDEDLKPGPISERSFGLYHPSDLTMVYDVGLSSNSFHDQVRTKPAKETTESGKWCVAKEGATEEQLQANIDYACGRPNVDCRPIATGGACYLPNTIRSHATYAMNLLYQASPKNPWDCDFSNTASLSSHDPSYGDCSFPGR